MFLSAQMQLKFSILGNNSPLGVLFASLLFGVLRNGSSTMELFIDIPRDLIRVLEGTIILFSTVQFAVRFIRRKKNADTD